MPPRAEAIVKRDLDWMRLRLYIPTTPMLRWFRGQASRKIRFELNSFSSEALHHGEKSSAECELGLVRLRPGKIIVRNPPPLSPTENTNRHQAANPCAWLGNGREGQIDIRSIVRRMSQRTGIRDRPGSSVEGSWGRDPWTNRQPSSNICARLSMYGSRMGESKTFTFVFLNEFPTKFSQAAV
jgi:hypothetical protein